jgi:hypothetical protein
VNYGFGWMKVVFDGRVLCRMKLRVDWVKELIDLVKFLGRYEGLKVSGY